MPSVFMVRLVYCMSPTSQGSHTILKKNVGCFSKDKDLESTKWVVRLEFDDSILTEETFACAPACLHLVPASDDGIPLIPKDLWH